MADGDILSFVTAHEQAQEIVEKYCPESGVIKRRSLTDAIRWAIIQTDIQKRQPPELTPAQAGSIVYQILFFVDEWTRTLNAAEYPEQANRLAQCRRKILEIILESPRKPMLREVSSSRKVKGAHV